MLLSIWKNSRNLSALQNIDPSIQEIISDASHIAVYEFATVEGNWKRYNVEGAAFVVRKVSGYLLIVLNKQGLNNLVLDLADCVKTKIQTPYIMLKCSTKKAPIIFGLWFHNDDERSEMFEKISTAVGNIQEGKSSISSEFKTDGEISKSIQPSLKVASGLMLGLAPGLSSGQSSTSSASPASPLTSLKNILNVPGISPGRSSTANESSITLLSPSDFTGVKKIFYRDN